MPTPLSEVYDFFLSKVKDYSFIQLNKDGVLEDVLKKYLRSAIVRFTNSYIDLDIDDVNNQFVETLSIEELEILSTLMVHGYVSSKILNVKNMEQIMSDKDYKTYSTANHLDKLILLRKEIQSESSQLMGDYSLRKGLEDFA